MTTSVNKQETYHTRPMATQHHPPTATALIADDNTIALVTADKANATPALIAVHNSRRWAHAQRENNLRWAHGDSSPHRGPRNQHLPQWAQAQAKQPSPKMSSRQHQPSSWPSKPEDFNQEDAPFFPCKKRSNEQSVVESSTQQQNVFGSVSSRYLPSLHQNSTFQTLADEISPITATISLRKLETNLDKYNRPQFMNSNTEPSLRL